MLYKILQILIFILSFSTYSQNDSYVNQKKSLDDHLNTLRNQQEINDSNYYTKSLDLYLVKAKKQKNVSHIINGYVLKAFNEKESAVMHIYVDSINIYLNKDNVNSYDKIIQHQAKSTIYYIEKNYPKALEHDLAILQLIDKEEHPYEYYKTIYSIGQTYYYLHQFEEAYNYFSLSRSYFEKLENYNYVRGFHNSLRYEALTASKLYNHNQSLNLVNKGRKMLAHIREEHLPIERAYLDYAEGLNHYHIGNYDTSISFLEKAIEEIKVNGDYANEHIIYYYIGLNYWAKNLREEAIPYFEKINAIFKDKQYSNLEIKDGYIYLINYYKELNKPEQALYYTNELLKVTVYLQNEYRYLNSTLHKQLDVERLEAEKIQLEKTLRTKNLWLTFWICTGIFGLLILIIVLIRMRIKQKEFKKRYIEFEKSKKALLLKVENSNNDNENNIIINKTTSEINEITVEPLKQHANIHTETLNNLLKRLDKFEKEEEYLDKDISLNYLASLWNTNRTYLSSFINEYRGKNFIEYLYLLRIQYFLQKIELDHKWKNYKISHIAEMLGFSSARSFSNAFLKVTGMSPSYYMQQEKERNENKID